MNIYIIAYARIDLWYVLCYNDIVDPKTENKNICYLSDKIENSQYNNRLLNLVGFSNKENAIRELRKTHGKCKYTICNIKQASGLRRKLNEMIHEKYKKMRKL